MNRGLRFARFAGLLFLIAAGISPAGASDDPRAAGIEPAPRAYDPGSRAGLFGVPIIDMPAIREVGDFTGDGIPDLLGLKPQAIVVRPGIGPGLYGPDVETPLTPRRLVFARKADFNGDGRLDLAVGDNDETANIGSIRILRGRGDGGFDLIQTIVLNRVIRALLVADLTNDGRPDLAYDFLCSTASGCSGTTQSLIVFLRNTGDGTMTALTSFASSTVSNVAASGDVDGDGDTDLVMWANGVCLFRNMGGGSFQTFVIQTLVANAVIADLDGDGKAEIILETSTAPQLLPTLRVIRADHPPSFGFTNYPLPANGDGLTTADFNLDGALDVALSSGAIFHGNGHGALTPPPAPVNSGLVAPWPQAFDYDGDGRLDILASQSSGFTTFFPNRGDDTFPTAPPFATRNASRALVAGQFVGDGRQDIVAMPAQLGELWTFQGTAQGFTTFPTFSDMGELNFGQNAAGDLDGDGDLDLAIPTGFSDDLMSPADGRYGPAVPWGGGVLIGLADGPGHFVFHMTSFLAGLAEGPVLADFDEDGKLDIIAPDWSTGTSLLRGHGDGNFDLPVSLHPRAGRLTTADWNADGHVDLVIADYSFNALVLLLGMGNGTFQPPIVIPSIPQPMSARAGDFDGDGHLDLAVLDHFDVPNQMTVLFGAGDGTFLATPTFPLDSFARGLAVADFDRDGFDDLFVAHTDSHAAVYYGRADRTLAAPFRFAFAELRGTATFASPYFEHGNIVTFDLDFNGRPDVAIGLEAGLVLMMNGGTPVDPPTPVAAIATASTVECASPGPQTITLDGSASAIPGQAPGGGIVSYAWTLVSPGGPQPLGQGPILTTSRPLGVSTIRLDVVSPAGRTGSAEVTVNVRDTTPPSLSLATSSDVLFPPNHRLVPVAVQWQATDACDPAPAVSLVEVTSDEPDDAPGVGDGSTTGDIGDVSPGQADGLVSLRAERSAQGAGRVYRLRYVATDASGNATPAEKSLTVPLSIGGIVEPLAIDVIHLPGSDPFDGSVVLSWPDVGPPYDVLVGRIGDARVIDEAICLGPTTVFENQATAGFTDTSPDLVPLPGEAIYYLVQYHDPSGPSGYGSESTPVPRLPDPCP